MEGWLADVLDDLSPALPKQTRREFAAFVCQQAMTKKGRFYRVHFKTGIVMDFVPTGSIAMGRALIRDEAKEGAAGARFRFVFPPLGFLKKKFDEARPIRRKAK